MSGITAYRVKVNDFSIPTEQMSWTLELFADFLKCHTTEEDLVAEFLTLESAELCIKKLSSAPFDVNALLLETHCLPKLYFKYLPPDIPLSGIKRLFSMIGPVHSVKLLPAKSTPLKFRCGFINFYAIRDVYLAGCFNQKCLISEGKQYNVMVRDACDRPSVVYSVKVRDTSVEEVLFETFSQYGALAFIDRYPSYAIIGYVNEEGAKNLSNSVADAEAISYSPELEYPDIPEQLTYFNNSFVSSPDQKISEVIPDDTQDNTTNLYIKNLAVTIDEARLKKEFSKYGIVQSVKVMRHLSGVSKRIAFVNYDTPRAAREAQKYLDKASMDGRRVHVSFAHRRFGTKDDPQWGGDPNFQLWSRSSTPPIQLHSILDSLSLDRPNDRGLDHKLHKSVSEPNLEPMENCEFYGTQSLGRHGFGLESYAKNSFFSSNGFSSTVSAPVSATASKMGSDSSTTTSSLPCSPPKSPVDEVKHYVGDLLAGI
eukprot:NODE_34_length_36538_cov_0.612854.p8 type:complete len:483 gc:universal NODE_34_length_36538_cov_0.612854:13837-15285(+)